LADGATAAQLASLGPPSPTPDIRPFAFALANLAAMPINGDFLGPEFQKATSRAPAAASAGVESAGECARAESNANGVRVFSPAAGNPSPRA